MDVRLISIVHESQISFRINCTGATRNREIGCTGAIGKLDQKMHRCNPNSSNEVASVFDITRIVIIKEIMVKTVASKDTASNQIKPTSTQKVDAWRKGKNLKGDQKPTQAVLAYRTKK